MIKHTKHGHLFYNSQNTNEEIKTLFSIIIQRKYLYCTEIGKTQQSMW